MTPQARAAGPRLQLTGRVGALMRRLWPQTPSKVIAPQIGARNAAQVARTARRLGLAPRPVGRPRRDGHPCAINAPGPSDVRPVHQLLVLAWRCPVCHGKSLGGPVHPACGVAARAAGLVPAVRVRTLDHSLGMGIANAE